MNNTCNKLNPKERKGKKGKERGKRKGKEAGKGNIWVTELILWKVANFFPLLFLLEIRQGCLRPWVRVVLIKLSSHQFLNLLFPPGFLKKWKLTKVNKQEAESYHYSYKTTTTTTEQSRRIPPCKNPKQNNSSKMVQLLPWEAPLLHLLNFCLPAKGQG